MSNNITINTTVKSFGVANLLRVGGILAFVISILTGCSNIKLLKPDSEEVSQFREIYFLRADNDARDIAPIIQNELEKMGILVHQIDNKMSTISSPGTGFLFNPKGYVLTRAHAVGQNREATVWLHKTRYEADVLTVDKKLDLAVLKTRKPPAGKTALSFNRQHSFSDGDSVDIAGYPIKNPGITLFRGTVDYSNNEKNNKKRIPIRPNLPSNLPINHLLGSSGGPLLDAQGRIVGVYQETMTPLKVVKSINNKHMKYYDSVTTIDTIVNFLNNNNKDYLAGVAYNRAARLDEIALATTKVSPGITDKHSKPKLIVSLTYESKPGLWHSFNSFELVFYEFSTQELRFKITHTPDSFFNTEDAVIGDAMDVVRNLIYLNQD